MPYGFFGERSESDPDERKYKIIATSVIAGIIVVAIASYLYLCRSCF